MVKTATEENIERKHLFSEETIKSLFELGEVLRKIHSRILSEGYIFKENQFTHIHEQSEDKN
jgi:hypothetical protein